MSAEAITATVVAAVITAVVAVLVKAAVSGIRANVELVRKVAEDMPGPELREELEAARADRQANARAVEQLTEGQVAHRVEHAENNGHLARIEGQVAHLTGQVDTLLRMMTRSRVRRRR